MRCFTALKCRLTMLYSSSELRHSIEVRPEMPSRRAFVGMVLGSEATNGAVSVVQGSALHRLFVLVAKVAHRAPVDLRRGCHSSSIDEASRRRKLVLRLPRLFVCFFFF